MRRFSPLCPSRDPNFKNCSEADCIPFAMSFNEISTDRGGTGHRESSGEGRMAGRVRHAASLWPALQRRTRSRRHSHPCVIPRIALGENFAKTAAQEHRRWPVSCIFDPAANRGSAIDPLLSTSIGWRSSRRTTFWRRAMNLRTLIALSVGESDLPKPLGCA